jgi:hypothetical protein
MSSFKTQIISKFINRKVNFLFDKEQKCSDLFYKNKL